MNFFNNIFNLILLTNSTTGTTGGEPSPTSFLTLLLPFALMFVMMYFLMIRPQNKKKKQEEQMRNNLQVGDEVTTIGGLMGRVVSIREDTESLVIETGADRSKIRIKKWAIASCDTIHDDEEGK